MDNIVCFESRCSYTSYYSLPKELFRFNEKDFEGGQKIGSFLEDVCFAQCKYCGKRKYLIRKGTDITTIHNVTIKELLIPYG